MKTLSILFILLFLAVSGFARVRSVPPEYVKVLNSRVVDSVELRQVLVSFDGKMRVCVVRMDCSCIVTRKAAVSAFGYSGWRYVKRNEIDEIYAIINK